MERANSTNNGSATNSTTGSTPTFENHSHEQHFKSQDSTFFSDNRSVSKGTPDKKGGYQNGTLTMISGPLP